MKKVYLFYIVKMQYYLKNIFLSEFGWIHRSEPMDIKTNYTLKATKKIILSK